jgi:predicted GNAT family acetyltransferase
LRHYIIPLGNEFHNHISRYLIQDEPWHIIPLDALLHYGLEHPQHRWYGEMVNGQLIGILYQHGQLLHFAYHRVPLKDSPLYSFIQTYIPHFITHGKKDMVDPIIKNIHEMAGYQITLQDTSEYIQQTPETKRVVEEFIYQPESVQLRLARHPDLNEMLTLFRGSKIESQVDRSLIYELIQRQRVIIAQKFGRIVGTIMKLKESPHYVLLGGLYVQATERENGIAGLLGKKMIQHCIYSGKKVCFYYSEPELKRFYSKAAFLSIGKWVSYSAQNL